MPISLIISALLVHSASLRADFLFSKRFSTPKTTPTPKTSYTSLNSFHSSMILNALLSKFTVNEVFLYPLELNQLSKEGSLRCLLTSHTRKSSIILLEYQKELAESLHDSSKRLKIWEYSKTLFFSKEAVAVLNERYSYSPLIYSIDNMLSCKAKYSD